MRAARAAERRFPLRPALAALAALAAVRLAAPLLGLLRLLDSGICAQLPTHMLYPAGVPLPLCARNTGIYSGAALTLLLLHMGGRGRAMRPPPAGLVALLLGAIAVTAMDGANSLAADLGLPHPYAPANALRLLTGLMAGSALALLLAPVTARALYGPADPRPPLERPRQLAPYGAAAAAAFAMIWSTASWTLYPVALVSNVGLLAILGGANLGGLAALAPGRALAANGAARPLALAALAALAELAALAWLRGT